jgi:hypothetical protein
MIEKSLLISLIVLSIHVMIYWPGMILHFIADWSARKNLPVWLEKPLFSCPVCQVPWWGSLIYWLFLGSDWREWIICIFAAMGINSVIVWFKSK